MTSKTSPRERATLDRLANRRRLAEERLSDVRLALSRELGALAPRRAIWAIPVVAFACGMVLALASKRRKKRRDTMDP